MDNLFHSDDVESMLDELSSAVDPEGPARVIGRVERARSRRRLASFAAGLAVASLVVTGVGATFWLNERSDDDAPTGDAHPPILPRDQFLNVDVGTPCPGAVHADSAQDLKTAAPIWPARSSELTDAWTCGATPVLMYGDVQISYENGWKEIDPATEWKALASEDGGSVETVHGKPAYVHPATETGPRVGVMFVVNDTLVRLLANKDVSVASVIKLAEDLDIASNAG